MMFWSGTFEYTSVDGRAVHDTFNEIKIGTAAEKNTKASDFRVLTM